MQKFHSSLISVLTKLGAPVVYLQGTSVGALIAAKLSEAKNQNELPSLLEPVIESWNFIERNGPETVFPIKKHNPTTWWGTQSLLSRKILDDLMKIFDPEKSVQSIIRCDITVNNNTKGVQETFSNNDKFFRDSPGLFREVVIASASLAPFWDSVRIGEQEYSDSGSIDLIAPIRYGCNTLFVLSPLPRVLDPRPHFPKFPWLDKVIMSHDILLRSRNEQEFQKIDHHNKIVKLERKHASYARKTNRFSLPFFMDLVRQFPFLQGPEESPHFVRRVQLFAEPPGSLTVSDFKRGDITNVRERAEVQMKQALAGFLSPKLVEDVLEERIPEEKCFGVSEPSYE